MTTAGEEKGELMVSDKISSRHWLTFVLYGLIGQIAWTIENMYLNIYIYKTVTYNPDAIAIMVAASAIVATIATLTMGALSDKIGKRKVFIHFMKMYEVPLIC